MIGLPDEVAVQSARDPVYSTAAVAIRRTARGMLP
jgi:hypothetical protein